MSKYTISLYDIVNSLSYNNYNDTIYNRINIALPKIFSFDFPIWSEQYRTTLERKIILHFIKKEICCETFALWQLFLNERLNLIMPYYNQLYSSILQYDITKEYTHTESDSESINGTDNSTLGSTNTVNGNSTQTDFDFPQGNVTDKDYASFKTEGTNGSTNSTNGTNTKTTTSTKTNTHTSTGNNTNISELIIKYRESIINIDNEIMNKLDDLFMQIY